MIKHNILVVDDDTIILESISDVLSNQQYTIVTVTNGIDALEILNNPNCKIDLIISDIAMPELTGFDILSKIARTPSLNHIPVILLSANNDKDIIRKGFRYGAVEFLDKPFRNAELLSIVHETLDDDQEIRKTNIQKAKHLIGLQKTLKNVSYINSHSLRHSNSKVLQLLDLVREKQMHAEDALEIIGKMGEEIDTTSKLLQEIMDSRLDILKQKLTYFKLKESSNIWFIDDDGLINLIHQKIVGAFLKVNIKTFLFAKDALNLIEEGTEKPDVIFLDINMPQISGFDFLDYLEEKGIQIPVVMLSSSIQKEDIDKSLAYENVVTYLTKPLRKDTLELLSYE